MMHSMAMLILYADTMLQKFSESSDYHFVTFSELEKATLTSVLDDWSDASGITFHRSFR